MCFSDFLRVYNKLFVAINFPPNYVGFRAHGTWVPHQESGGLPIHNSEEEFKAFPNNPQYYLQLRSPTKVFISLLQNDARLSGEKYPFSNSINKVCLIICTTDGRSRRVNGCEDIMEKTPISQRRDVSLELELQPGDYVIMPCTLSAEDKGDYCLEIYLKDTCTEENKDPSKPMKFANTIFEKSGGNPCKKYELIKEGRESQIEKVDPDKLAFMYHSFLYSIDADDEAQYESADQKQKAENDAYDNF